MGTTIGIDLGTTNTAIAVLTDGRPRVLEDEKGYKVLPSCVSIKADGSFTVGQAAKSLIITEPDRTVYAAKRLLGRRYDTGEVNVAKERVSYEIAQSEDGNCLVRLGDEYYTPVEVSALILQVVKGIAERAVGDTVDEAVITVPAYFNHAQRAATLEAAELAGLRCDRLLNEPTAAALAYGYKKDIERTILVFDLGGGTFDVSVLRLSTGVYEVLSTSGDTFLGGEDFDYRLVDHLAEHFQSNHGVDLREDRTTLQRLKDAAERAKCELSFTDRTTVMVPRITATENLELAVSRLTLESLVQDLVDRTMEVTKKAVSEAGLQASEIDDIILVGGQTRMPKLREAIAALFRKDPSRTVHPEEVVAIGAAVHASSISEPEGASTVLLDVTPFDLGIDVAGGLFQTIIARNSPVPATAAQVFATAQERQETIRLTIRQGESRFAEENESLGEFLMSGLTPAPRMETKVEVSFRLDNNGMLHVTAKEPLTGESRRVTIRNYAEVAQSEGGIQARLEGDVSSESDIKAAGQSARDAINNLLDGDSGTGPKKKLTRAEKKALKKQRAEQAKKAKEDAKKKKLEEKEAAKKKKLEEKEAAKNAKKSKKDAKGEAAPASTETTSAASIPTTEPSGESDNIADSAADIEDVAIEDIEDLTDLAIDDIEEIEPIQDRAEPDEPSIDDGNQVDEEFGFSGSLDDEIDAALRMAEAESSPPSSEPDTQDLAAPVDDVASSIADSPAPQVLDIEADEPLTDASTSMDVAPDLAPLHLDSQSDSSLTEDGDEDLDALVADALAELGFDDDGVEDDLLDLPTGMDASEIADEPQVADEEVHDEDTDTGSSTIEAPMELGDAPPPIDDPILTDDDDDLLAGLDLDLSTIDDAPSDSDSTPASEPSEEEQEDVTVASDDSNASSESLPDVGNLGDLADDDLFAMPDSIDQDSTIQDEFPSNEERTEDSENESAVDLSSNLSFADADSTPTAQTDSEAAEKSVDGSLGEDTGSSKPRRKPARLKLAYSDDDDLVVEYQENLRRGGCFVSTTKPLSVGRSVEIHVSSPGIDEPIVLKGTVTWSSAGMDSLPEGQSAGMGIEYTLDADEHLALEEQLLRLKLGL